MLTQLTISNYAIIKNVSVHFDKHLNIITGETGAGKSILIDSLSLILGNRIDWAIFENQIEKCFIEGHFNIAKNNLVQVALKEKGIEIETTLICIRREINPSAKTSRAFINDSLVSLTQLSEIASFLLDLHQQFDALEILDSNFQLNYIDAFAENFTMLKEYQYIFNEYQKENNKLKELIDTQNNNAKDLEYYTFLNTELDEMNFKENEIEDIDKKLKILNVSEKIQTTLNIGYNLLTENENSITLQLQRVIAEFKTLKTDDPTLTNVLDRLNATNIELKDISSEMQNFSNLIDNNPKQIEVLNDRLNSGYKLLKKHNVKFTDELIAEHKKIKQHLAQIENIDELLTKQTLKVNTLKEQATQIADILHQRRAKAIEKFIIQTHIVLSKIGMPNAVLQIDLEKTELNFTGLNKIAFLIDTNKTGNFKAIKKVVSGGELNRLMLSIKSIIAKSLELPSLIFDEIDTGVSGEVAKQLGEILKSLSEDIQIICITHQATIAARGDKHYFVYKQNIEGKINTTLKELTSSERIEKIAEILSGTPPTANAIAIAKELIQA